LIFINISKNNIKRSPKIIKIVKKHFIMEKENLSLLNYFDKFKAYPEFNIMKDKLTKQSYFRYHYDINIGGVTIPYVGPDEKLSKFSKEISKKWGEEIGKEMEYVLKYFEGGEIENLEEALIVIEIKYRESLNENFLTIKDTIIKGEKPEDSLLQSLIFETDSLSASLLFYLLKL